MGRPALPDALTPHQRQVAHRERVKAVLEAARWVVLAVEDGDIKPVTTPGANSLDDLADALGRLKINS